MDAHTELDTLEAIFGDALSRDGRGGCIDVALDLDASVEARLAGADGAGGAGGAATLRHLPPLQLCFNLPPGYPQSLPPAFHLHSPVHPPAQLATLTASLAELWPQYRDPVLFAMVDLLQHVAVPASVDCDAHHYRHLLDYNHTAAKQHFSHQSFTCQICQDDHRGLRCTRLACGHVFCNTCLYDYFTALITEGDVARVHCPSVECTQRHVAAKADVSKADAASFSDFWRAATAPPISVAELAAVLQNPALVARYQALLRRQQHELVASLFPARLAQCPNCPNQVVRESLQDALVICRQCDFAFCHWCRKLWHGTITACRSKRRTGQYAEIPPELLQLWLDAAEGSPQRTRLGYQYGRAVIRRVAHEYAMDRLFDAMLRDPSQGIQRCPTCDVAVQRLDGCNKMTCSTCGTHFCNLCGVFLEHDRPYEHFRDRGSACYGLLFEGMPGV